MLKVYNNEIIEGNFYRHEIEPIIYKDDVYVVKRLGTAIPHP